MDLSCTQLYFIFLYFFSIADNKLWLRYYDVREFFNLLNENKSLRKLNLTGNYFDFFDWKNILNILKSNQILELRFDNTNNKIVELIQNRNIQNSIDRRLSMFKISLVVGVLCLKWMSKFWRPNPFQIPSQLQSFLFESQYKQIHKTPLSRSIKK